MTSSAHISHHLDLYRYWERLRGDRPMPARRDIDPAEIRRLLPYIAILDRDPAGYRWRLVGTAIAADMGRDLTGKRFGGYAAPSQFIDAMAATFDRVLGKAQPMFEESAYETDFGAVHAVSRLLLPLSGVDSEPAMVIFTRITRRFRVYEELASLNGAKGRIRATTPIGDLASLTDYAAAWEQGAGGAAAESRARPWIPHAVMQGSGFDRGCLRTRP